LTPMKSKRGALYRAAGVSLTVHHVFRLSICYRFRFVRYLA
jgi:hypothetical protein